MALTQTQVSELYVAIFNRASEGEGNQFWQDEDLSAAATADAMLATGAAADYFGTALDTDQAFVEHIYLNTLNKTPADDAVGIQFWVDQLADGVSRGEMVSNLVAAARLPENAGPAQEQFLNRVSVSDYTADNLPTIDLNNLNALTFGSGLTVTNDPNTVADGQDAVDNVASDPGNGGGTVGDAFGLTEGRDNLVGTANDDMFVGDVGQNQNGSISNALSTGDFIDGGDGTDAIVASIMEDQEVDSGADAFINARTVNVEQAFLEAMSLGAVGETVTVDAGRMDSVQQFWSDNSSANLVIDDVRLGSKLSVTKDITFGMRSVDADAGLSAWFDTNSLTNEGSSAINSALLIRAADVSTETPATPLSNVELEIGFTVGGEQVDIVVQSTDGTYSGLRLAIDNALDALGQGGLVVSLANPYNEVVFAGNTTILPFTAQEILITDPNGNEFDNVDFQTSNINPVPGGFLLAGNAAPQDPSLSTTLIESNLILDNAGRGSTAGDVVIGGLSNSGAVVEKLNLTVDRDSKIDALGTGSGRVANAAFQQIVVDSAAAQGDLVIGNIGNAQSFDSTAFTGENLAVTGIAGANTLAPGQDVDANADDEAYAYNTSSSNDTINVTYAHDKAAEFADYSLSINTGGGNDVVNLQSVDTGTFNLPDQQALSSVVINTGSGNDTVTTAGDGAVLISTGAGDDTVYTDNTGEQVGLANIANSKAQWVFNNDFATDANEVTDLLGDGAQAFGFMPRSTLTVTFSGATTAGGGVTNVAAAALTNGFESVVDIDAGADGVVTRAEYNTAIKAAINLDPVLSKLLFATDGPNNTLVIQSLIDGEFTADDLAFDVFAPDLTDGTIFGAAEQAQLLTLAQAAAGDSTLTLAQAEAANQASQVLADAVPLNLGADGAADIVGAASGNDNDGTVIDAGPGSDLVVLSTNADSNETVAFTGVFGDLTVVNFDDDAASPGVDMLDFTSYLTTQTSASGSVDSAVTVGTTSQEVGAAATLAANSVTEYTGFNSAAVAGETWAALTASNLLAAIQDSNPAGYGNLGDIDPAAALGNLVGNARSHIFAIENDANAGEYKVFQLTSSDDGGVNPEEFTAATLLGTVDFGANIDLSNANDILVG